MSFDPPKSRTEAILQNMLGANNVLESPKSREEELLLQILQQGGTGGGVTPEQLATAIATYFEQHPISDDFQTKAITDTGGYFTTDTVEGALQEIGAELASVNTLIGTGVIT